MEITYFHIKLFFQGRGYYMLNLTVIIPVYNVEKYLHRCVDSVLGQTELPKQIILVDDGSTDNCGMICDDYAQKCNNITIIHQKNQGLSAARNSGINHAVCDLVTFVDSDDYIEANMYEKLYNLMIENDADIAVGGVWVETEEGSKRSQYKEGIKKCWTKKEALIELNSYQYFNMSFCDKVFKKSLFQDLRFPVGKLCEDYYLMHKIIAKADRICYTSQPFYHYIQRMNSISRNKKINLAPIDASLEQLQFYQKNFPDLTYVAETACAFSHMGIYTAHVRNDVECPKDLLKYLRAVGRRYLKSVMRNSHIPKVKKMQALMFCVALPVYSNTVKRRLHR